MDNSNSSSAKMPPVNSFSNSSNQSFGAPAPLPNIPSVGSRPIKSTSDSSLLKTIIIVLETLLLIAAGLLSYYFFREYRAASTNIEQKIDTAVSEQSIEIETNLRAEYDEKEKEPYKTFTGPADFGSLSFKFPKTWSVYIEDDASNNKEFKAYLHPDMVPPLNDNNPIALVVNIETEAYETYLSRFSERIKKGDLKSTIIRINGEDATRLEGVFSENMSGALVAIKIRDKVALLYTEATIYLDDFNKIIETITFNQ